MTSIGPLQLQTFSLALALAILLSAAVALRQRPGRPGAVIDVCLLALATGLLAARSGHILLHAAHFSASCRSDILASWKAAASNGTAPWLVRWAGCGSARAGAASTGARCWTRWRRRCR